MKAQRRKVNSLTQLVDMKAELDFDVELFDGCSIVTNIGTFTLSPESLYLDGKALGVNDIKAISTAKRAETKKTKQKKTKVKN